jgi:hypothetical protein
VLVAALGPYERALGVLDLRDPTRAFRSIVLESDSPFDFPIEVGVTARGTALVMMHAEPSNYVIEVELATGSQRRRPEAVVRHGTELLASGDRRMMVLASSPGIGFPEAFAQTYDVAADAFGDSIGMGASLTAHVSLSSTGHRLLAGDRLFAAELRPLASLFFPLSSRFPQNGALSALAPDGLYGYFAQDVDEDASMYVVRKVRLSDGVVVESIVLPGRPHAMQVVAGGDMLIVWQSFDIVVMDLR